MYFKPFKKRFDIDTIRVSSCPTGQRVRLMETQPREPTIVAFKGARTEAER